MIQSAPERPFAALRAYSGAPQFALQQVAWWACVLWMSWFGPAVMLLFIGIHLVVVREQWRLELMLVMLSGGLGLCLDTVLFRTGSVSYVGDLVLGGVPLWLIAIWAGFGATLRHSQRLFMDSAKSAALSGLLCGPLAYWGGEKLERLTIHEPSGYVFVALLWAGVLLALHAAIQWLEGQGRTDSALSSERAE